MKILHSSIKATTRSINIFFCSEDELILLGKKKNILTHER